MAVFCSRNWNRYNTFLFDIEKEEFCPFQNTMVKFSFSEKVTKTWKNLPLVLKLLSITRCFVKTSGKFFPILWPSQNVFTLYTVIHLAAQSLREVCKQRKKIMVTPNFKKFSHRNLLGSNKVRKQSRHLSTFKIEIAVQSILVIKAWDSELANALMSGHIGAQSLL